MRAGEKKRKKEKRKKKEKERERKKERERERERMRENERERKREKEKHCMTNVLRLPFFSLWCFPPLGVWCLLNKHIGDLVADP